MIDATGRFEITPRPAVTTAGSHARADLPRPPLQQSRPNKLPLQLTRFVGRKQEIATIKRALSETRLLTLIGPGGCGKTRLALETAAHLLDEFPDGVWWAELAEVTEPTLLPQAIASALALVEHPGQSSAATLTKHLSSKHRPMAVLQPASVDDVVRLIRYTRDHQIKVAPRGSGHNTHGQAHVADGTVVDMRALARIRSVTETDILVDGGIRWIDLVHHTLPRGLTPPTLTDSLQMSVGGTLSVGGIGGQTFRHGMQTDNVLELEVVTGRGNVVRCSADDNSDLFHTCRAGLGQFRIIVGARIRLVAAPSHVRMYTMFFADLMTFMATQERLIDDGRFDYLVGFIMPMEEGTWGYMLLAAAYYASGHEPDDRRMLADLAVVPGKVSSENRSYFDFINRTDAEWVPMMKESGLWNVPHPWVDLFLPAAHAVDFIDSALSSFDSAMLGNGLLLTYLMDRSRCQTPFFRLPDDRHVFLFDVLRNAVPATQEHIQALIDDNRRLYKHGRRIGAKLYLIGSVPMQPDDWQYHFEPDWKQFVAAKRRLDPDMLLTPGQGIF